MQAYQENISAKVNGVLTPILGVKVTVTDDSTGHPATLFSDNGVTQITSDIITDETGYFGFFASNGSYTVSFSSPQIRLASRNIDLYDPLDDAPLTQSQAASPSGASRLGYGQRTIENKLGDVVSVKDKGAVGDGNTDDTANIARSQVESTKGADFPSGTYSIKTFPSNQNATYRGIGNPTLNFFDVANPVKVAFQSGSRYQGITFSSTIADLNWQRTAIEDQANVILRDCGFFGFRHANAAPNAWGVLIQRSSNITLENPAFGNNSQSDIALTDTVRDVTIINASNTSNNGVLLNVEPNGNDGVVGMSVLGGHYREIRLLENNYTAYASRAITVNGARVDKITYDGSGASFAGCEIGSITNAPDGNGDVYAGALVIDNLSLGKNLIADERFMDVGASDANSYWAVYATGGTPWTQAIKDADGRYVRTNPAKGASVVGLIMRNFLPVTAGESLILFNRARVDNTAIAGKSSRNITAFWHDAGGTRIGQTGVINCRSAISIVTPWCDDVAVLVVPSGATQCKIQFGAGDVNSISTDQSAAGLFRFKLGNTVGNMRAVLGALASPSTASSYTRATVPTGAQNYAGYFIGDRVINLTPVVGQPKAWVCTVAGSSGAAGTWVSEGNL